MTLQSKNKQDLKSKEITSTTAKLSLNCDDLTYTWKTGRLGSILQKIYRRWNDAAAVKRQYCDDQMHESIIFRLVTVRKLLIIYAINQNKSIDQSINNGTVHVNPTSRRPTLDMPSKKCSDFCLLNFQFCRLLHCSAGPAAYESTERVYASLHIS